MTELSIFWSVGAVYELFGTYTCVALILDGCLGSF